MHKKTRKTCKCLSCMHLQMVHPFTKQIHFLTHDNIFQTFYNKNAILFVIIFKSNKWYCYFLNVASSRNCSVATPRGPGGPSSSFSQCRS